MSTVDRLSASSNPHINTLEQLLATSYRLPEWLIITHDDLRMVRSLSAAVDGKGAAMLRIPQESWDFRLLGEAIQWAMAHGTITDIVLAAHSQAYSTAELPPSMGAGMEPAAFRDGYERLIDGVQRHQLEMVAAASRFSLQMRQLSEIPAVADRVASSDLTLHGLMYRADSGLFLAYCAEQQKLSPLLA